MAVEGESEQAFVVWLQRLATELSLPIHLDGHLLGGGGFSSMIKNAVQRHDRQTKNKGAYKARFLMVDQDRALDGDWTAAQLRTEAAKNKMALVLQRPNHEGLLYRLHNGKENEIPTAEVAETRLKILWPTYQKPLNANALYRRFTFNDLRRLAAVDEDLNNLLQVIGLS